MSDALAISPSDIRDSAREPVELTVEARAHGWRVDHYLSRLFPNYSRTLFQKAIEGRTVLVNGLPVKAARRLRVNDRLSVQLPELPDRSLPSEDIPLEILFEDEFLVAINKPAGMIVHPGKGNYRGTLAAALQFHFDQLSDLAGQYRPGIVHRLDRDTSGVLVIAKNNQAHHRLSGQFERREVTKEYRALVWGRIELQSDYIETGIGIDPRHREKMRVTTLRAVPAAGSEGREAKTFYEVVERFDRFTHVRLFPRTGRTHQLRVHMQHLGHPIVADRQYGGRPELRISDLPDAADDNDVLIGRQALHALRLEIRHPDSGQQLSFEAPLADDIQTTLDRLRAESQL